MDWLLTKAERGNPATMLDARHPGEQAWAAGCRARALVHGGPYFAELYERIEATGPGDIVWFTDWRGDPDERLTDDPRSGIVDTLARAAQRGVDVRGLVWRSHWDKLSFSGSENRRIGEQLQRRGAEVLLDMRVRTGGSHHQKLVVIRYRDRPERDIAFLGGIDLCHTRRDDEQHSGDPQALAMAHEFGDTPPWHDVQLALEGPVVHDAETVFRERWLDPTPLSRSPLRRFQDRLRGDDLSPDPLPAQTPPPPAIEGGETVQLLRTYPNLRRGRDYPYARGGERSVARGYSKALAKAEQLVYLEDQYLWSNDIAAAFEQSLRASPGLHVIGILPRATDQDGALSRVPQHVGRLQALDTIERAAPERVGFFSPENPWGTPVYVHAKVCVMDDLWASVGSDNFNRRSWTHDSELSAVVIDPTREDVNLWARRTRLRLMAEHLGRTVPAGMDDDGLLDLMSDCLDPASALATFARAADELEAWWARDRRGDRPASRVRRAPRPEVSWAKRLWALPAYELIHDPDGRPASLRRSHDF